MKIVFIIFGLIAIRTAIAIKKIDDEKPIWFWILLLGIIFLVVGIFNIILGA